MSTMKLIMHPTDFSARSKKAFELSCSLAKEAGARLLLLHVIDRPKIVYSGVAMAPPPPPISEEERTKHREELHRVKHSDASIKMEHRLEEGDPAMTILSVAKEIGCDMIVLGTHGRSGIEKMLLGSVAEKVLQNAACPVVTVKMP